MLNTLEEVRAEIDRLDRSIVALLAQREACVRRAADFKKNLQEVPAPARVEQVIARVRAAATEAGADPSLIEQVYRTMIAAFIQKENEALQARQQ